MTVLRSYDYAFIFSLLQHSEYISVYSLHCGGNGPHAYYALLLSENKHTTVGDTFSLLRVLDFV